MSNRAERVLPGERVRLRSDAWRVLTRTPHEGCDSLRLEGAGLSNAGLTRTFLLPFDRAVPIRARARLRAVSRRRWMKQVAGTLLSAHRFGALRAAAGAAFELLPYQLEPALAMLRHGRLRILIADEVGLGKTVQAGIVINELASGADEFRAIVVTPAGVREQWRSELESKFGLVTTRADAAWLSSSERTLPRDVNPWSLPGILVTSLDLVKRSEVLRGLEDVTWDALIVDEAHGATPATERLAAVRALASRARRVILLTATPPDGEPDHLAALYGLGRAPGEGPMTIFRRDRRTAGLAVRRRSTLMPVRLSAPERAMHRALERYTSLVWREAGSRDDRRASLAAVILRKRALSSAASLALSVRRRLELIGPQGPPAARQLALPLRDEDPLDDDAPDGALGAAGLADASLEREHLEAIGQLAARAAARESKLVALERLLRKIREPAIVFTEYRDTLARIAAALPASRHSQVLHGGLTPRERDVAQREFTATGTLLLATDAASEGLNLHHRCRTVVHFELPWTLTKLEQRTGRVDRLGQTRAVHEIVLVADDTAERLVLGPLLRRLRAAGTRGGRAWSRPGESAVAAAVMDGCEIVAPRPAERIETSRTELGLEAQTEAARLAVHRTIRAGSRAGDLDPGAADVTVVHAARRGSVWTVVAVVALEDPGGRHVHSDLILLSVATNDRPSSRRARDVAAWADQFVRGAAGAITKAARAGTQASCHESAALVRRQNLALLAREAYIAAAARPSRVLLQPGLFDRRVLRRAAERIEAAGRLTDEATGRRRALLEHDRLHVDVRIVAMRS